MADSKMTKLNNSPLVSKPSAQLRPSAPVNTPVQDVVDSAEAVMLLGPSPDSSPDCVEDEEWFAILEVCKFRLDTAEDCDSTNPANHERIARIKNKMSEIMQELRARHPLINRVLGFTDLDSSVETEPPSPDSPAKRKPPAQSDTHSVHSSTDTVFQTKKFPFTSPRTDLIGKSEPDKFAHSGVPEGFVWDYDYDTESCDDRSPFKSTVAEPGAKRHKAEATVELSQATIDLCIEEEKPKPPIRFVVKQLDRERNHRTTEVVRGSACTLTDAQLKTFISDRINARVDKDWAALENLTSALNSHGVTVTDMR